MRLITTPSAALLLGGHAYAERAPPRIAAGDYLAFQRAASKYSEGMPPGRSNGKRRAPAVPCGQLHPRDDLRILVFDQDVFGRNDKGGAAGHTGAHSISRAGGSNAGPSATHSISASAAAGRAAADRQRRAPGAAGAGSSDAAASVSAAAASGSAGQPGDRREHRPEPASPAPQAAPATAIPIPVPAVLARGRAGQRWMRPARARTMMVPMVPQREAKAITEAEARAATDRPGGGSGRC